MRGPDPGSVIPAADRGEASASLRVLRRFFDGVPSLILMTLFIARRVALDEHKQLHYGRMGLATRLRRPHSQESSRASLSFRSASSNRREGRLSGCSLLS